MTNSAFQGGDTLLKILSALAIHLLKCMAKAHTRQDSFNTYVNAWQSMTNSAFQGGEQILSTIRALAIHLLKCMAEAEIDAFSHISALKSGVSHFY